VPLNRRITVGAINIVTHPHTASTYAALMEHAFSLKLAIGVFGEQRMLLRSIDRSHEQNGNVITGTIARFTEIDPDLPWFNSETMDIAAEEEVRTIVIPPGLKPNFVAIYFAFFVDDHILVFEQEAGRLRVSPAVVMRFFSKLLADNRIEDRFGPVDVSLIADRAALKEIIDPPPLKWSALRYGF
jgi:hypothetical protein